MNNSAERGFTLIELIISISIGSILILVVSASIRTGLTYMKGGDERFDKGLKERIALNFFTQQITSVRSYIVKNDQKALKIQNEPQEQKDRIFFIGKKDLVFFVSPLSLDKYYTYGLWICAYTIKKDRDNTYSLVYNEKRLLDNTYLLKLMDTFSEERAKREFFKEEPIAFFQGYKKIKIEYLEQVKPGEEEKSPWKESWKNEGLPKAIKITLLKSGETQEAITPIMATS